MVGVCSSYGVCSNHVCSCQTWVLHPCLTLCGYIIRVHAHSIGMCVTQARKQAIYGAGMGGARSEVRQGGEGGKRG